MPNAKPPLECQTQTPRLPELAPGYTSFQFECPASNNAKTHACKPNSRQMHDCKRDPVPCKTPNIRFDQQMIKIDSTGNLQCDQRQLSILVCQPSVDLGWGHPSMNTRPKLEPMQEHLCLGLCFVGSSSVDLNGPISTTNEHSDLKLKSFAGHLQP